MQQVGDQVVSGVEFEILSGYNPLPAAPAAKADVASDDVPVIGAKSKRQKPSPDAGGTR